MAFLKWPYLAKWKVVNPIFASPSQFKKLDHKIETSGNLGILDFLKTVLWHSPVLYKKVYLELLFYFKHTENYSKEDEYLFACPLDVRRAHSPSYWQGYHSSYCPWWFGYLPLPPATHGVMHLKAEARSYSSPWTIFDTVIFIEPFGSCFFEAAVLMQGPLDWAYNKTKHFTFKNIVVKHT